MKIIVTGLRGIPGVQGGVETHSEQLYPLLVKLGCDVEVIGRSGSLPKDHASSWKGIRLKRLWSPKTSGLESFMHTFIAVIYAAFQRPDILHIHAIGPAIMTPIARMLGLNVVVTHHGPDYDREKWGKMAKQVLLAGEKFGMKWSNQRIVISKVIQNQVKTKYGLDSVLIPNGTIITEPPETKFAVEEFKLIPNKYVLQVSRLVPEKRQLDLIKAFIKADLDGWKLVLVGRFNPNEPFAQRLMAEAKERNDIVFTDFQSGLSLQEILSNAGIFVLPSSHEGLPIALLEALSFGLRVIASDIPANLEINLPKDQYFHLGEISELAQKLRQYSSQIVSPEDSRKIRNRVAEKYDWQAIAQQTLSVYKQVVAN